MLLHQYLQHSLAQEPVPWVYAISCLYVYVLLVCRTSRSKENDFYIKKNCRFSLLPIVPLPNTLPMIPTLWPGHGISNFGTTYSSSLQ